MDDGEDSPDLLIFSFFFFALFIRHLENIIIISSFCPTVARRKTRSNPLTRLGLSEWGSVSEI